MLLTDLEKIILTAGPSTVLKALLLLDFFNERRSSIGLSEFAKLSGYNKATTLRFLTALEAKGFLEQDQVSREYVLGPAFLRFSILREASFPFADAVNNVLRDLNAETKETAHACIVSGDALVNIGVVHSKQTNRIIIEAGETMPFHATASGLCVLAFSSADVVTSVLDRELEVHAKGTITDPQRIAELLEEVQNSGIAYSDETFCDGVLGIAAPYFGQGGVVCGAVALALPSARAKTHQTSPIQAHVKSAARRLTALKGGKYPNQFPD